MLFFGVSTLLCPLALPPIVPSNGEMEDALTLRGWQLSTPSPSFFRPNNLPSPPSLPLALFFQGQPDFGGCGHPPHIDNPPQPPKKRAFMLVRLSLATPPLNYRQPLKWSVRAPRAPVFAKPSTSVLGFAKDPHPLRCRTADPRFY